MQSPAMHKLPSVLNFLFYDIIPLITFIPFCTNGKELKGSITKINAYHFHSMFSFYVSEVLILKVMSLTSLKLPLSLSLYPPKRLCIPFANRTAHRSAPWPSSKNSRQPGYRVFRSKSLLEWPFWAIQAPWSACRTTWMLSSWLMGRPWIKGTAFKLFVVVA